jgi:anthranilate synthase/aminodeoxychorismate synthase-like glutamine amidotransferase
MLCRVIVVDAYDSFVHILVEYLEKLGCFVTVYRKDDPHLHDAIKSDACDMIVLGPGPGHPSESGYAEILEANFRSLPVLGVCLGHQAIGLYYDCKIEYAKNLMHGKQSLITHDGSGCFKSYGDKPFLGMRYHSIIVSDVDLPSGIEVTARSNGDDYVMGLRHKELPIEGIQFHPESIGTDFGINILRNFIDSYVHKAEGENV